MENNDWKFRQALQAIDDFRRDLANTPSSEVDISVLEGVVQEKLNAMGRTLMEEVLKHADVKTPEVTINGKRWGNRRESPGTYYFKFGEVKVNRSVYSPSGGGPVAVPLELRLGMVEGRYSPQVASLLCRISAVMTAEEGATILKDAGVATLSSSTLKRLPKFISARHEINRDQINEQLRCDEQVPMGAHTVQVGIDGVMVPMDGENTKPRGRKAESPKGPRHEIRYGPTNSNCPALEDGLEGRAWHEASVATLAFYDKDGNELRTVYLGRMPEVKMGTLADDLEVELNYVISQRPDLDVVFASDGDRHQWEILEQIAMRLPKTAIGQVMFLLDFYHAAEHLGEAASLVFGDGTPQREEAASSWCSTLKSLPDGAERVLKKLRYHRDQLASKSKQDSLQKIIDYLAYNKKAGRLNYYEARSCNKPIGTGVTEAACKTVVNTRMKRSGMRFEYHGGQTAMMFRTAHLSGRFPKLMSIMTRTYTATVEPKIAA
jgi:hypothetical protein